MLKPLPLAVLNSSLLIKMNLFKMNTFSASIFASQQHLRLSFGEKDSSYYKTSIACVKTTKIANRRLMNACKHKKNTDFLEKTSTFEFQKTRCDLSPSNF